MDLRDFDATLRAMSNPGVAPTREEAARLERLASFIRLGELDATGDRHWWWTGTNDQLRNGLFTFRGKTTVAHRAVYEVAHGPILRGQLLDVCPGQDPFANKYCVSPFHTTRGKETFRLEPGEEAAVDAKALLGLLRQAESILAEVRDGLKTLAGA